MIESVSFPDGFFEMFTCFFVGFRQLINSASDLLAYSILDSVSFVFEVLETSSGLDELHVEFPKSI